jgi:hypothetical protein
VGGRVSRSSNSSGPPSSRSFTTGLDTPPPRW